MSEVKSIDIKCSDKLKEYISNHNTDTDKINEYHNMIQAYTNSVNNVIITSDAYKKATDTMDIKLQGILIKLASYFASEVYNDNIRKKYILDSEMIYLLETIKIKLCIRQPTSSVIKVGGEPFIGVLIVFGVAFALFLVNVYIDSLINETDDNGKKEINSKTLCILSNIYNNIKNEGCICTIIEKNLFFLTWRLYSCAVISTICTSTQNKSIEKLICLNILDKFHNNKDINMFIYKSLSKTHNTTLISPNEPLENVIKKMSINPSIKKNEFILNYKIDKIKYTIQCPIEYIVVIMCSNTQCNFYLLSDKQIIIQNPPPII